MRFLPLFCLLLLGTNLNAMGYLCAPTIGLMQQPTSQYYHYVYGVSLELSSDSRSILGRYSYIERPRFESAGFSEQEFGNFLFIGSQLTKKNKWLNLAAYLGAGQMNGYIAHQKDHDSNSPGKHLPMRSYQIKGLALLMEAAWSLPFVQVSLSHQHFSGMVDRDEFDAYVAWPFNFYLLSAGMRL